MLIGAVVVLVAAMFSFNIGGPVLLLVVMGLLFTSSRSWFRRREEKRHARFVEQLPELARLLANATSAGLSLRASLAVAAQESVEPTRGELQRVVEELSVGSSVETALERMGERLPSRELAVLVNVLVIQSRAGGRIVTALQGITEALETRRDLRREVNTLLAGSKATVMAVAFLGGLMVLLVHNSVDGGLRGLLGQPDRPGDLPGQRRPLLLRHGADPSYDQGGGLMAFLTGLVALACFVMGVVGYRMVKDPGVATVGGAYYVVETTRRQRVSLLGKLLVFLDRAVGGRVLGQIGGPSREKLRLAIGRAGSPDGVSVEQVIQRQATWAFLGGVVALLLLANGSMVGLIAPVFGWFLPRFGLWSQGRGRTAAIERELPDFLDVLAVSISAGLGFRAAMRRVATLVGGPVGDEMLVALRQIDLGATRRNAFEEMRDRVSAVSLQAFITAFLQAEELGTPLSGFLESYSAELRRTAGQRARTAAAKANPKISLILTLIIMPALSIFMIGSLVLMAFGN